MTRGLLTLHLGTQIQTTPSPILLDTSVIFFDRFFQFMRYRKIGVLAPGYTHRSAGISVLHFLIHSLRELGFDAYFIPLSEPSTVCPKYNTPSVLQGVTAGGIQEIREEWVIVYPEIVSGNPLEAKRVVRYLLNYEAALLGKGMEAGPDDFILTYSRLFHPTAPVLYYPYFEADALIRAGKIDATVERTLDAFYAGKGKEFQECPPIPNAVQITRNWPPNKSDFYDLLGRVRVFYSYDWLTSTAIDAALMGCEVRLIGSPVYVDPGALFSPDLELNGFWQRDSATGLPFVPSNSHHSILTKIKRWKLAYLPKVEEIFHKLAAF